MRITLVAGEFPKRSETFVLDQVLYLARAGHQVSVICDQIGDPAILEPTDRAVLQTVEMRSWPRDAGLIRRLPWRVRGRLLRWMRQRRLRQRRADVVLAHFGRRGALVAGLFDRVEDFPPLITVYHGRDVAAEWQENRLQPYQHQFRLGALHLPVNSAFAALLATAGAPANRVCTHHLGVPVDEYLFQPRHPLAGRPMRLLSVCRLVEKKGISITLRALAALKSAHPTLDWRYDIGGEGPETARLQALVSELDLGDRVTFLGPLQHADTLARIGVADVLVQPSVTAEDGDQEGIPVILMEAMALGAIVCSTQHSGIPELVEHGISGLLAPEHDVGTLAENLRRLAMNAVDIPAMAQAARHKIEQDFAADTQNAALVEHLRSVLRG